MSQSEYWTLDGAGTADVVRMRLHWEDAFRSGIGDFSADLQVTAFTGTQWETAGNGGLSSSLGAVESAQPVGVFGAFAFGSLSPTINPLTTQLVSFTAAQPRAGVVDLKWNLTSETTTYGYAVERAFSTTGWQQIGFVASQAITAQARQYRYQDQSVQGLNQASYRLRQTTAVGAARYSATASVWLASTPLAAAAHGNAVFAMYPNPASGRLTLQLPGTASAQVLITDLSGRLVQRQVLRGSATTISLSGLSAGVYLLQVQAPGISGKPQRLIVQ